MQTNLILGGVAAAQALAVIGVWIWSGTDTTPEARALIPLSPAAIEEIAVTADPQASEPSVRLVRSEEGWSIGSADGPPADSTKIEELIESVTSQQGRSPVATSSTSHSQLGVSDQDFVRRLHLKTSQGTTTLTVGGGRTAHLRIDDGAEVWRANKLSPWSIRARPVDWVQQPYLTLDASELEQLTLPTDEGPLSLSRSEGAWQIDPPDEGVGVNPEPITQILNLFAELRAGELADDPQELPSGLTLSWSITQEGTSKLGSLTIGPKVGDWHLIRAEDQPYSVKVRSSLLNPLTSLTRSEVIVPIEPDLTAEGP